MQHNNYELGFVTLEFSIKLHSLEVHHEYYRLDLLDDLYCLCQQVNGATCHPINNVGMIKLGFRHLYGGSVFDMGLINAILDTPNMITESRVRDWGNKAEYRLIR